MNSAAKRILSALLLLGIFSLALYLRFYGLDWGYKDGSSSQHPDEWHYKYCSEDLNFQGLTVAEKELPWREQLKIYYERNLQVVEGQSRVGNPGLKIRNYNYGTFPLFIYVLYQSYLVKHFHTEQDGWTFLAFPDALSLVLIVLVLGIGFKMYRRLSQDLQTIEGRNLPWYKDEQRMSFFFPCLLIPFTGLVLAALLPNYILDFNKYQPNAASFLIIGRVVTAYAGALTVLLAYLIGRDAYNRSTGLLAAFMLAVAMIHVQTSHFATTDVILGFWTTAAVYCFLQVSKSSRLPWYILGALSTGCAVGTKWSGITLPGILLLAHTIFVWSDNRQGKSGRWIHSVWVVIAGLVLGHFYLAARSETPPVNETLAAFRDFYLHHAWLIGVLLLVIFAGSIYLLVLRKRWYGGSTGWLLAAIRIYRPWVWLGVAIIVGLGAFLASEPMAYFDAKEFGKSIAEQSAYNATGSRPIIFTQQYRNTLPFFYLLDNLFYPSLDWITAFFVVGGCIYAFSRFYKEGSKTDLLLFVWVVPSFLIYSNLHSKFPRYLDSILPVMLVLGARWIVSLSQVHLAHYLPSLPHAGTGSKRLIQWLGRLGGTGAVICGLVYGYSYVKMYDQPHTLVSAGAWMRQHMKPGAKVTQNTWDNGIGIHVENRDQIRIHEGAEQEFRNPQERVRYFARMLHKNDYIVFPSKRGYGTTLQNPDRFPLTNQFLRALFCEQLGFKVAKVFTHPPQFLGWEFRTDEEDETARIYDHPKVIIFEKTEDFSTDQLEDLILNPPDWVAQVSKKELLTLRDGFPVYASPPTHPLLSWMIFIFVVGWIGFILLFPLATFLPDRGYGISKIAGLALFSWIVWFIASTGIAPVSASLFVLVFIAIVGIAVWMAYQYREAMVHFIKQKWMFIIGLDILFLVSWGMFLGIRAYHPAIIGGEKPFNAAFINAVYQTDTFPPEDPWASGYPINYYYYGHAIFSLAGRAIGLPSEYLFNIGGTTVSALAVLAIFSLAYALSRNKFIALLASYLSCFAGHFLSYYNFVKFEMLQSGRLTDVSTIGWKEWFAAFIPILHRMYDAVMYYTGFATPDMVARFREMNYDQLFWASSRVIPHTVANEFPYWTHLFLDFHAHHLVIPFVFAFFVLLYNYFVQPKETFRIGNVTAHTFFLGLLLGTVICTNTWDLPALGIAFLLITAVKFYREFEGFNKSAVRPEYISSTALHRYFCFPIAPVLLTVLFAILLFIPFHVQFVPRVGSVRFMTEGNTLLTTYLGFWMHLLFSIVIAAVLFAILRANGSLSLKRSILFVTFFMLSVAAALIVTRYNLFHFPSPRDPAYPSNYSIVGLFLPFLLVFFLLLWRRQSCHEFAFSCLIALLGLGISVGIEIVYIHEPPAWFPPDHRWNTAFKFNLQAWHYLSIAAALSCVWVWHNLQKMGEHVGSKVVTAGKMIFLFGMILVLLPTIPFAVLGPVLVTKSSGYARDARGEIPTLDGLSYLRLENPGSYKAVQWVHRFLKDHQHILELSYRHGGDHARFSSYTGIPTLIGWPHHTRERLHYVSQVVDQRVHDMDLIYTSNNKDQVRRLLGQYGIDYLIFGQIERETRRGDQSDRAPLGTAGLEHLEQMGDLFQLVYRNEDTSIFKVNTTLNRIYGMQTQQSLETKQSLPPALRPPETGASLFQGGRGDGNGMFLEPRGLVSDATGNIYVADTRNNRIQVFRADGTYAWQAGSEGSGEEQFKEPNDITLDPQTGRLYIADTWNHRIVVYHSSGVSIGSTPQSFFGPRGIVFHPKWRLLYFSDTGNHRIVVMTPEGKVLQTWSKLETAEGESLGRLREPVGIDVSSSGTILVVDSRNRRVIEFSSDGKVVRHWPLQTSWNGEGGFEGHVAYAPNGTVYVTDPHEGSVHVYSQEGELREKIQVDIMHKPLVQPVGITCTPQGYVLVSDLARNQVARVK